MNIAIVGGSGFIGTHTSIELIKHGHDVTVIDIVAPTANVRHIKADVTNYDAALHSLNVGFDVVYMFAAVSDSAENLRNPLTAVNKNILSLTNVLHAMHELNINKIVFSSTVWVYSVTENIHVDEDTPLPVNSSEHIYTTCKLTCESLIRNYTAMYGINHVILRYGIAYGPGCHPDTILSKFITNALCGRPLTITGNGDIYRNFLYVHDHARGNRLALDPACNNQTINLEGPEKITLTRVAETVKRLHDGPVNIIYTNQRAGDYQGKIVCNDKSKDIMNWTPTVLFKTGAKNLYEHIKQQSINCSTSRG